MMTSERFVILYADHGDWDLWTFETFDTLEQAGKIRDTLVEIYGYDIRIAKIV